VNSTNSSGGSLKFLESSCGNSCDGVLGLAALMVALCCLCSCVATIISHVCKKPKKKRSAAISYQQPMYPQPQQQQQ
jgi:hypothetical protein